MIYCNLDNFHVSKEDLRNSPSRFDGISEETEMELRNFGTTLIQEGGTLLDLPQVVMATAQVLFHRFFCKKSMAKYDVEAVASTSVWLACKLEEENRNTRHVLAVFYRLQRRRINEPLNHLDYYSKEYAVMKRGIIDMERIMLREFGFIVHVDHPHKLVLNHVNLLYQAVKDPQAKTRLMQEAFNLTNDSLRTTLCVRFKSETVACGLVFMAARRLKVALPTQPPWWQLFGVRYEDICEVCCEMQALYARPKAQFIDVRPQAEPQGTSLSMQATPQASPLTANGQPSLAEPADPSSPPLVQADSAARSEGGAEEKQDALPNGVSHGSDKAGDRAAAEREAEQRPSKSDRAERKRSKERDRERHRERERDRERDRDGERDRDREYTRERDRNKERDRERDRDRERERDRSVRAERHRPSQADWRDRRDADRRPDREGDVEGNGAKAARPDRASSAAAANGRSSRSPHKGSRRPIDWAAYKRGRDADDLLPPERPPREAERSGRSDGKRSRQECSSSPSDS